jgi:hypothetical protein
LAVARLQLADENPVMLVLLNKLDQPELGTGA